MINKGRGYLSYLPCFFILYILVSFLVICSGCYQLGMDNKKDSRETQSDFDEEEDPDSDNFKPITTKYNMETTWNEKCYGKWKKESSFKIKVEEDSIKTESTKTSINKLSAGTDRSHDEDVKASVSNKDTMVYEKTSSSSLESLEKKDSNYKRGVYAFLFVDKVDINSDIGGNSSFKFSSPIPFVPRTDLTHAKYEDFSSKKFDYTYSVYDSVFSQNISFKMSCSFNVVSSSQVEVVIKNEIISSGLDDSHRADLYGRFPILKSTTYKINTKKKRMLSFTGNGRALVSGVKDRFKQGEIANVDVNASLTSYKVEGSREEDF